jgi:hypothetical protein
LKALKARVSPEYRSNNYARQIHKPTTTHTKTREWKGKQRKKNKLVRWFGFKFTA